mmetsp:Transcript_23558/g.23214  ORF Transcript_23558/g.23214 Transcript_23558/m.23214 type:complete len:196 (-) Transcript_23558:1179-1766(-)
MHEICFSKEENTHMNDLSTYNQDPTNQSLDQVLKIIFEGLGILANTMPDEIAYIFLPKLKEQIIVEKGEIFQNNKVQNMFRHILKNFSSVELSLSLFESLIKQNITSVHSQKFLEALQMPILNFSTIDSSQISNYHQYLSQKCIQLISLYKVNSQMNDIGNKLLLQFAQIIICKLNNEQCGDVLVNLLKMSHLTQ